MPTPVSHISDQFLFQLITAHLRGSSGIGHLNPILPQQLGAYAATAAGLRLVVFLFSMRSKGAQARDPLGGEGARTVFAAFRSPLRYRPCLLGAMGEERTMSSLEYEADLN
jgi:hypothetical protein